ncbi:reverse transcriptase domain-containing protein [Oscillospiraceae bacterium 21-37]
MTSEERREARYQRRQEKRAANRQKRCEGLGPIGKVFSYREMFKYGRKCCNGVRWKQSVQNFEMHLFSGTAKRRRLVLEQAWKPMKCSHFTLRERGKIRPIDAPHVSDRQVHKTLCNNVLVPLYSPSVIRHNGASQKGRGLHWQFGQVKEHLRWHYRRYGRQGGVLLMDLKQFFPSAPHKTIYQRHQRLIPDPHLRWLADTIIAHSPCPTPGRGMPLGVEPSQQEMVALPSAVDNWLKCQKGIKCMGHYMDDYYVILPDIAELKKLAHEMVRKFAAIGVPVNQRKCKIIPLTKPFKFCKAKFRLQETGKVIVNGCRDGMKRARRKLKYFKREVEAGRRAMEDVKQFMTCQLAYYKNYNDHGRVLRLSRLCFALFGDIMGGKPCIELPGTGPASA